MFFSIIFNHFHYIKDDYVWFKPNKTSLVYPLSELNHSSVQMNQFKPINQTESQFNSNELVRTNELN